MSKMKSVIGVGLALLVLTTCSQTSEEKQMKHSQSQASSSSKSAAPQTGSVQHGQIVENSTNLSPEDQAAIIARYEEFQQALIERDMTKLRQLLPDDYIAVHITGRRQTKEEWLADIESGDMRYFDFSDVSYSLSPEGNRVLLGVRQRIRANIYGSEGTWSIPGNREFEKEDGQWKIVG